MLWGWTRTYNRTLAAFILIGLLLLCIAPEASAASGYSVSVNTADYVSDIIYHTDGTVSYGAGHGFYTITNPTSHSPIFSANVITYSGSTDFIDNIAPLSNYTGAYAIDQSDVRITLRVKETITPGTLTQGKPQQVSISVEIRNADIHNVTGFKYTKNIPSGLSLAAESTDQGTLVIGDNITWLVDCIPPSGVYRMNLAFNVTPSSNINFPEAYVWYTSDDSLSGGIFGFLGSTVTSFSLQKTHTDADTWNLYASIPDDSEFAMNVAQITIYRSDVTTPFDMAQIREFTPNMSLSPGELWDTSFTDTYDQTPAYFMKVAYQLPYTVNCTSQPLTPAKTDPFTITVPGTSSGGTVTYPYVPTGPTAVLNPTATAQPYVTPTIEFVEPKPDATIHTNNTTLEAWITIPQASGFVVFYSSRDNESWTYLGRSSIVDNTARYTWDLPETNGRYYLKAEYYDSSGLSGTAYQRIQVQHEPVPMNVSSFFSQTADWALLLTILALLLIITLFVLPPMVYRPVIFDASALQLLSEASMEDISRLPRALRPNNVDIPKFKGSDRIKPREVKKLNEQKRFESQYGMHPYDAAALELARERNLTIYSDDPTMMEIYRSLNVHTDKAERFLKKDKK